VRSALSAVRISRTVGARIVPPACVLLALVGCGGAAGERAADPPAGSAGKPLRPAALHTLPSTVRGAIRQARRDLGAGSARLRIFVGRRSAALRVLDGREPLVDGNAVIATFTGIIDYRRALARPGDTKRVAGRFGYVMLDPRDGTLLELGVMQSVPVGVG
jgi:hypothetical protein